MATDSQKAEVIPCYPAITSTTMNSVAVVALLPSFIMSFSSLPYLSISNIVPAANF